MSHQVTSRCLPQHTLPPTYEVFIGRQPIYTQDLDVFAYELLFRSGEMQHAGVTDGNQATKRVLKPTLSRCKTRKKLLPSAECSARRFNATQGRYADGITACRTLGSFRPHCLCPQRRRPH